jgi:hypothetical protein
MSDVRLVSLQWLSILTHSKECRHPSDLFYFVVWTLTPFVVVGYPGALGVIARCIRPCRPLTGVSANVSKQTFMDQLKTFVY